MNTCNASSLMISADRTPLLNPYNTATTLNLSSCSGSTTYANAFTPLSEPWHRQVETFSSFIVSILICANRVKWDAASTHSILSVPTGGNTHFNILTEYQSISSSNIKNSSTACIDDHEIKNLKGFLLHAVQVQHQKYSRYRISAGVERTYQQRKCCTLQYFHIIYRCLLPPTLNPPLQSNKHTPSDDVLLSHPQNQHQVHRSVPAHLNTQPRQ